ncbi:hypothetical protein, partial [Streptomyces sp. NPDC047939]|uniref:hypothetical protein n=1 Tax=Streptomyces sp. NPDC047939 TaxID=3155381 RepID=UPI003442DBE6
MARGLTTGLTGNGQGADQGTTREATATWRAARGRSGCAAATSMSGRSMLSASALSRPWTTAA